MSYYLEKLNKIISDPDLLNEISKVAFDSVDKDRSGLIDYNELAQVMSNIANTVSSEQPSDNDVDNFFKKLDSDCSGKISFEEFKVLIKEVFILLQEEENQRFK